MYGGAVPSFVSKELQVGRTLKLMRWTCDGHDGPRVKPELARQSMVMVLVSGRFEFRDRWGRAIASPLTAIAVERGHEYEIRHPAHGCGDETLSIMGELPEDFVDRGRSAKPVDVAAFLKIAGIGRLPVPDALAAEENALGALELLRSAVTVEASRSDLEIAAAIDHAIDMAAGVDVDLDALAREANVSTAHACRAYRRVRGTTIHARVNEVRLRQALALVIDTDRELAAVATETGFANQGHLGNAFRARFGTSPGRARRSPELVRR
jgi:AraC-like DNA-binding protein